MLGKLFLMEIPFLLIGGVFIYLGFTTDNNALTDDGYNLKNFFFLMGGSFIALSAILFICISVFTLLKIKRLNTIVTEGK